jgi:tyrosine-protein kinase Etk/Wzc
MENKDNLIGVLETIFKWKKYIVFTCLAVGIGAIVTVLLVPVYYQSTTVFYAASPDLADPSLMYGRGSESMRYYGVKEDIDRIMSIAKSSELANFLINEYDLYNHYDIDTSHELAEYYINVHLASLYDVERTKEDAIELSIEDEEKELAAQMANAARNKINEIGQRLIKQSLNLTVETYRNSLADSENKLDSLGTELRFIRDSFGVYNVETQSEAMAGLVSKTEAGIQKNNAKVSYYKNNISRKGSRDSVMALEARLASQEAELIIYKRNLDLFNQGFTQAEVLGEVQLEASEQLGKDRERYRQILSVYHSTFPAIHVLEEAPVPVIKSRPKRMLIVTVSVILAFILSTIAILVFDTYRDVNWKEVYEGKNAK